MNGKIRGLPVWTALKLKPSAAEVAATRHRIEELFTEAEVDPDQVQRVLLALSELVTNAVVHGSDAEVSVELRRGHDDELVLCVAQEADGSSLPDQTSWRLPDSPGRIGGRGLAIVAAIADAIDVHADRDTTQISARFAPRSRGRAGSPN